MYPFSDPRRSATYSALYRCSASSTVSPCSAASSIRNIRQTCLEALQGKSFVTQTCWLILTAIHGKSIRTIHAFKRQEKVPKVLPRTTTMTPKVVRAVAMATIRVQQAGTQGLGVQKACIKATAVVDMIKVNTCRLRRLLLLHGFLLLLLLLGLPLHRFALLHRLLLLLHPLPQHRPLLGRLPMTHRMKLHKALLKTWMTCMVMLSMPTTQTITLHRLEALR